MSWEPEGDILHGPGSHVIITSKKGLTGKAGYTGPGEIGRHGYTGYTLNFGQDSPQLDPVNSSDSEEKEQVIVGFNVRGEPVVRYLTRAEQLAHTKSANELKAEREFERERAQVQDELERQKLNLKTLQAQQEVDLDIRKKELALTNLLDAKANSKTMINVETGEKQTLSNNMTFRFAYYMTSKDKVTAIDAIQNEFHTDWMHRVMFVLKSKQYPVQDWEIIGGKYACTLFDAKTILIFKKPIPDRAEGFVRVNDKGEPIPLWYEEDLVVSNLNWK